MPPVLHGQAEACRHRWPGRALRAALRPASGPLLLTQAREIGASEASASLYRAKLRALVKEHWKANLLGSAQEVGFPFGAAVVSPAGSWVLVEKNHSRALGPILALTAGTDRSNQIHVMTTGSAGALARRASLFDPSPTIWQLEGRSIREAVLPQPEDAEVGVAIPSEVRESLERDISKAGAQPVWEAGVLRAEVLGLEVARVVQVAGQFALSVGVGKNDRLGHEMLGTDSSAQLLRKVVDDVRQRRRASAPPQHANNLVPERWLREVVLAAPGLVGAARLERLDAPMLSHGLLGYQPAAASGSDMAGNALVAVFSRGVDVDLVPTAAHVRWWYEAQVGHRSELLVVIPQGDDLPFMHAMVARLGDGGAIRTVPRDWKRLS